MEFCVDKRNGKILSVRPDGAIWGSGESYSRYVDAGLEAGRWVDRPLLVLLVPDLGELDGYRYEGGLVDVDWLSANEDPEPTLSLAEWTNIALTGVETEPDI